MSDQQPVIWAPVIWTGPSGHKRIDPHRIRAAMVIMGDGRRRVDRTAPDRGFSGQGGAGVVLAAHGHGAVAERPLRVIDSPAAWVLAVPDLPGGKLSSHDRDMLGAARQVADGLSGAVVAVCFADPVDDLGLAGVDRVLSLYGDSIEAKVSGLKAVAAALKPAHVFFNDSPVGGADLGRRVAAGLKQATAAGVWKIEGGMVTSRARGGSADLSRPITPILLVAPEVAMPVDSHRHEARAMTDVSIDFPHLVPVLNDLGPVQVDPNAVPLAEAEFIVSCGNGVTDMDGFHAFTKALRATEGASRVSVDAGLMPRSRQVGATGTLVSARVYVAVGISGASQHLQGITKCDKVVAINRDLSCDMVKRADLSVIGDAQEIMPALVKLIAKENWR